MMKPPRQSLVSFAAAAILIVAGVCLARPRLTHWHDLRQRELSVHAAIGQHRAAVVRREEWEEKQRIPSELLPVFPADKKMDVHWLTVMDTLAAKHGILITKRTVGEERRAGEVFELSIEVGECSGTDVAFAHFLFDLQAEGAMLDVRQLALRRDDKGGLRGRFALCCLFTREGSGRGAAPDKSGVLEKRTTTPPRESPRFDRYQVIVDRKTFGVPPPLPVPPAARSPFADLRLVAIIGDVGNASNTRVAFVDVTRNKSYRLALGDCEDDILVVDVDIEGERVLLRKGLQEEWLQMTGSVPVPPPAALTAPGPMGSRPTYAERLKQRRMAIPERQVQPPKLNEEDLKKHLEAYQMDLIRAGGAKGPPLPIPLSPAMDDVLVSEGVLPPQK